MTDHWAQTSATTRFTTRAAAVPRVTRDLLYLLQADPAELAQVIRSAKPEELADALSQLSGRARERVLVVLWRSIGMAWSSVPADIGIGMTYLESAASAR